MKAIVTYRNSDGTYDEVGMNNRTVITRASEASIRRYLKQWTRKGWVKVEVFFADSILGEPNKTFEVEIC